MAIDYQIEQPPFSTVLINQSRTLAPRWVTWVLIMLARLGASPLVFRPFVALLNQHAAIAATALLPAAKQGTYRVNWHLRITTVDGAASSIIVNIHSVEGGAAVTQIGTALNSDTLNAVLSGSVIATADAGSLLSYSTTYTSTTPAQMGYALTIVTEQLTGVT